MSSQLPRARDPGKLQTQRVDLVASLLMACLLVLGALVLLLFVYWLTQTFSWQSGNIVIEQERAAGEATMRPAGDIEPPGAEEAAVRPTLGDSGAVTRRSTVAAS